MLVKSFLNSANFQQAKQKPVNFTSRYHIKTDEFCNGIDKKRVLNEIKEQFGKTAIEEKIEGTYIDIRDKFDKMLREILNKRNISYRIVD